MNLPPEPTPFARALHTVSDVRVSLSTKIALVNLLTVSVTLVSVLVLTQSEYYLRSGQPWLVVLVVLLPVLAAGWFFSRRLTHDLRGVMSAARAVSTGDLRDPVRFDATAAWPDEVHVIAQTTGAILQDLRELVHELQGSAGEVGRAAQGLVTNTGAVGEQAQGVLDQMGRIAERTDGQSAQAEKQGVIITRMLEDLRRSADIAETAARSTRETSAAAAHGTETTRQVIGRLHSVFERVDAASEAVTQLSASTAQIHEIVVVISSVAQQTHLLSVNASIEAARAGETGQGFAVVAEEIRRLADSSGRRAEQIREIVEGIDRATRAVVDTMRASSAELDEGRTRLDDIQQTLGGIAEAARREAEKVSQLSDLTRNQLDLVAEVVGVAQAVRNGAERIAESTRQAQSASGVQRQHTLALRDSAEMLRTLASRLELTAGRFRL
jgi:methyl-accepting chemotaxis protein